MTKYRISRSIVLGLSLFFLTGLASGIATFDSKYFGLSLFGIIDWLTASILYFFFGALVGLGIDFWISKVKNRVFKTPEWFHFTWVFILISIIFAYFTAPLNLIETIKFPFLYGIFFPSYAYYLFFSSILERNVLAKLILDLAYLTLFGFWLKSQSKNKPNSRLLLAIIFLVQTIGMISRALSLK